MGSWWSSAGDELGGALSSAGDAAGGALSAAGDAAGHVLNEAAQPVVGAYQGIASGIEGLQSAMGSAFGGETDKQQGPIPNVVDETYTGVKGASRVVNTALQTPIQLVYGSVRSAIKHGSMFDIGDAPSNKELLGQTSAGVALEQYQKTGKIDLGEGFLPAGTVATQQAQNVRDVLTINGQGATPGRAIASLLAKAPGLASLHITQPGSAGYRVTSGLVDAGATWFGDPAVHALGALSDAHAADQALAGAASAEDVAKAAAKAPDEYRAAMSEAMGVVHAGNAPTIVPAQFDRFLYTKDGQQLVGKLVDTSSPYEIWLRSAKQMPVAESVHLANAGTDADVISTLRSSVGSDVAPGTLTGYDSAKTKWISSTQQNLRAANVMPSTWLPMDLPETFVKNLDDSLANANVMGDTRRQIMDQAFQALASDSPTAKKQVLDVAADAIKQSLIGHGVDEQTAERITSYKNGLDRIRHWYVDGDTGQDINFTNGVDAEGHATEGPKPVATIDVLNNGVHLYDPTIDSAREVRRLTSGLRPLVDSSAVQIPHSAIDFITNTLWRGATTMRAGMLERVLGEQTASAMASGKFDSAADWLNFVAFHRGETAPAGGWFDVNKEAETLTQSLVDGKLTAEEADAAKARLGQINDQIGAAKSEFDQQRIGRAWQDVTFDKAERNMVMADNWPIVHKVSDPFRWTQGIADRVAALTQDPVFRRVAQGGLGEGDQVANARPGLDGIVDWLTNGAGQKFRKVMDGVYPQLTPDEVARAMVDTAEKQIQNLVGDNADLRHVFIDGKIDGTTAAFTQTRDGLAPTQDLVDRLEQWRQDPNSPGMMQYHQENKVPIDASGAAAQFKKRVDPITGHFFGTLFGQPRDYLHGNPTFKAASWGHMEDLMSYLTPEAQQAVLANAEAAGLGADRIARLTARAAQGSGSADVEAAQKLADGQAADDLAALFHGGRAKSQFFDITRSLFPFGDVWKNMISRWANLVADNPGLIRRGQMFIDAGRGADLNGDGQGFFHKDPTTGDEVFSFPLPGPLADALGVQYKASLKGLAVGTDVHPGIGPVATLGLSEIAKHVPVPDSVTSFLMPYGTNSVVGNLLPASWHKVYEGIVGSGDVYANTFAETYRQLAASGDYNLADANDQLRLEQDATHHAQAITTMRGILQFFAPSAPQVDYTAKTFQGDRVAGALVKDFAQMSADQDAGKIPSAVGAFYAKYGKDAFTYMSGKTQSQVGGQEASAAYGAWEQRNPDLISKYPTIAGYFGPQGEGFDNTVFQRQEAAGNRNRQTPKQALAQAETMLGQWIWNTKKDQIGPHPTPDQSAWLLTLKDAITKQYPGWNPDAQSGRLPQQVRDLDRARQDPKVANTEIGQALNAYFTLRQQAFDAAASQYGLRGADGPMQSARAQPLRDWLRSAGVAITAKYPSFNRLWTDVLSHEMHDDAAGPGKAN